MKKRKSIKEQLATTVMDSKVAADSHLNQLDLNERIDKAEAIVKNERKKRSTAEKVIRDAFTMWQTDIETIRKIRQRCLQANIEANKSLIVRAGIQILSTLSTDKLKEIILDLPKVKIGRPKN